MDFNLIASFRRKYNFINPFRILLFLSLFKISSNLSSLNLQ